MHGHQPPPAERHTREMYLTIRDVSRNPVSDVRDIIILDFALMHLVKYHIVRYYRHVKHKGGPRWMMENKVWSTQACRSWNGRLSDARPPSFTCSGLHQGDNPIVPGNS